MIEDAACETEVGAREGKAVNATTVKPFFTEKKSFEGKIVTITRKPRPLLSFCRNFCAKLFPRKSHPTVNIEFAIKSVNWVDISKCHTNHFKNHLKHQFLKKRNNISMWKLFSEQYRQEGRIYRYMKSIYSVEKCEDPSSLSALYQTFWESPPPLLRAPSYLQQETRNIPNVPYFFGRKGEWG